jgi:hypothetical protein
MAVTNNLLQQENQPLKLLQTLPKSARPSSVSVQTLGNFQRLIRELLKQLD